VTLINKYDDDDDDYYYIYTHLFEFKIKISSDVNHYQAQWPVKWAFSPILFFKY